MSVRLPSGGARRDDDELLDRLGRGEPVDGGEVERMLYHWRASMPTAGATDERLLDAVTTAIARPARGHRRLRRVGVSAAALALLAAGALTAATQAGPESPLWPVTELVFGGLAESRAAIASADSALREARTALDQGRIPEATRLLAYADQLADKVDEPGAAERIRDDVAAIRERLGDHTGEAPTRAEVTQEPGTRSDPSTSRSTAPATDRSGSTYPADVPSPDERPIDEGTSVDRPEKPEPAEPPRPGRPGPPDLPGDLPDDLPDDALENVPDARPTGR